jgi:hypothetical protein
MVRWTLDVTSRLPQLAQAQLERVDGLHAALTGLDGGVTEGHAMPAIQPEAASSSRRYVGWEA